jgi:hypothetical protein
MHAFMDTGTIDLYLALGNNVPTLGFGLFLFADSKRVTIGVPDIPVWGDIFGIYSGIDNTENWGNGFRGMGWDGSAVIDSSRRNQQITLDVRVLP